MIPEGAYFRRAEGLWFTVTPCRGTDELGVVARRQGEDTRIVLPRAEVRMLSRLHRWQSAAELGVDDAVLARLSAAHCLFWSTTRPDRDLTSTPLPALDGPVALRGNVLVRPLISIGGGRVTQIPHMPRRGVLDDAVLAGARFEVVEWDTEVLAAAFACCRGHAAMLRELVPRLDGRHTVDQLATDHEVRALLEALDDLGLLVRHTPAVAEAAPQVTWLAHAGIRYQASGRRILIDPAAFTGSEPTRHRVRPFDLRDLGDIDAVLITHGDSDHLDPNALYRLPRTTPIVLPSVTDPQPYQVDQRRLVELLGFTAITEVEVWQRLVFGDVTVVAAPFRGEDWGLSLPTRTYLVASPELTIYANADSLTDEDACDRLAAEFAIDVAFVGVTGAAESHAMPPGYGYGHFYEAWIPADRHDEWVELCNGPRAAAEAARRLGARFAFGYAAGGAAFYPLTYSDRGTHAEMAGHLIAAGGPTRPLDLPLGIPTPIAGARAMIGR